MQALYPVKIRYDSSDRVYYAEPVDMGEEGKFFTYGRTPYEAVLMAEDALNLLCRDGEQNFTPSDFNTFKHNGDDNITWIRVDTEEYQKALLRDKVRESLKHSNINEIISQALSEALTSENAKK